MKGTTRAELQVCPWLVYCEVILMLPRHDKIGNALLCAKKENSLIEAGEGRTTKRKIRSVLVKPPKIMIQ